MTSKYFAIIPAAGIGSRMNAAIPKQYINLDNKALIEHAINPLLNCQLIEKIVVVLHPEDQYWEKLPLAKDRKIINVLGGAERCHSVYKGLLALKEELVTAKDWILVHDAARPYLKLSDVEKLIHATKNHSIGGLLGTPVRDTLKRTDINGNVMQTIERAQLWHAFTPQIFRFGILCGALEKVLAKNQLVTDEAAAVETLGLQPLMVQGRSDNIKITLPEDLK